MRLRTIFSVIYINLSTGFFLGKILNNSPMKKEMILFFYLKMYIYIYIKPIPEEFFFFCTQKWKRSAKKVILPEDKFLNVTEVYFPFF